MLILNICKKLKEILNNYNFNTSNVDIKRKKMKEKNILEIIFQYI